MSLVEVVARVEIQVIQQVYSSAQFKSSGSKMSGNLKGFYHINPPEFRRSLNF